MELANLICEWPNSQIDPPLVASLCTSPFTRWPRMSFGTVINQSQVMLEFFLISYKPLLSTHGNWRRSRPDHRSVANWPQSITGQSEVSHKWIMAVRLWLWFWGPCDDRLTNRVRGLRARKSVVVQLQVTLITWQIMHFLFTLMSVTPRHWCKC